MDTQAIYERKFLHYCHHILMPRFGYYDFPKLLHQKEILLRPHYRQETQENTLSKQHIYVPNQLITLPIKSRWEMEWSGYTIDYTVDIDAVPVEILFDPNGAKSIGYIHELCVAIYNYDFQGTDPQKCLELQPGTIDFYDPDTDYYIYLKVSDDEEFDSYESNVWQPQISYII